jgi:hypothetical protein
MEEGLQDYSKVTYISGGEMKRIGFLTFLCVVMIGSFGCATFSGPAREHLLEDGKTYWFDYDASRRGAFLIPGNDKEDVVICAEPSPDVAMEFANKFLAKLSYQGVTAETQDEINTKVLQLAQRTQTIMYLRESLYRLCELSVNNRLSVDQIMELYEKVIAAAEELAKAEVNQAAAARAAAETRKAEIDLEMRKLSREIIHK